MLCCVHLPEERGLLASCSLITATWTRLGQGIAVRAFGGQQALGPADLRHLKQPCPAECSVSILHRQAAKSTAAWHGASLRDRVSMQAVGLAYRFDARSQRVKLCMGPHELVLKALSGGGRTELGKGPDGVGELLGVAVPNALHKS